MEPTQTWESIVRLDNAIIVEVLSAIASSLNQSDQLSSKDLDDFRMLLSSLHSETDRNGATVLALLERQHSEFLQTVVARLGTVALYQIIMRKSFREFIQSIQTSVNGLGEHILKRSELGFNRPFCIYFDQIPERRTLYASFLLEQAEFLGQICQDLTELYDDLCTLPTPAPLREDLSVSTIHSRIADSLDFTKMNDDVLPFTRESLFKFRLAATVKSFTHCLLDCSQQLSHNFKDVPSAHLSLIAESLASEAALLESIRLPQSNRLELLEVRRHALLASLAKISQTIKKLCDLYVECITKKQIEFDSPTKTVSQDLRRYLTTVLVGEGIQSIKARSAVDALIKYVQDADIKPSELIFSEVRKVSPFISEIALKAYAEAFDDATLSHNQSNAKKKNLEKTKLLGKMFTLQNSRSTSSVVLFFLAFLISNLLGCGVKTAPRSNIIEPREPAPVRFEEIPEAASLQNASKDKNDEDKKIPPQGIPLDLNSEDELDHDFEQSE